MATPIPIYVIALKQSHDRRRIMTERLAALNLDFTFIDAVAGHDLSMDEINRITSPSRQNHLSSPLSKGAIGCGLSHLEAWRKIAADAAPMALILEDDAILTQEVLPILKRLSKLKGKIDIVNLHGHNRHRLIDVARLSETHHLASCRYNGTGTLSYVITHEAAVHLADHYLPMVYEVDLFINRWWEHGLHILTVNPPVIREDDSLTTIGYSAKKPSWPDDSLRHHMMRRFNRAWSSLTKRRLYPSMVAAVKMRLMGIDPGEVGNNPELPDLVKMTADD